MRAKPGIAIVGAGNWANALTSGLRRAGYKIDEVIARSHGASLRRVQKLAKEVGAQASVISSAKLNADIVWLCVPDAAIAHAAGVLAGRSEWKKKTVLHSSGAFSSDELEFLRRRGAAVASVHPMMTFVHGSVSEKSKSTLRSKPVLAGVPFAIEGDSAAVKVARRIVNDLGGGAFSIRKADKAAYHAWGTFASPLLTALLITTERVAAIAGVNRKSARLRMLPILQQTLANYARFDAGEAFSGPIIRGDVDTIKRHLQVLRAEPAAREVYVALVRAALKYLPAKNKSQLRNALKSAVRKSANR